jgi:hypothetical protein
MRGLAERVVALTNELRPLASQLTRGRNERDYLVHLMVLKTLREDPALSHCPPAQSDEKAKVAA